MARPKAVAASIDPRTLDGLVASLKGISKSISADVMAEMVKEGGKVVVRNTKPKVPVATGDLRASVDMVVRKRKNKGTAVAVVGPKFSPDKGEKRPSRHAHLIEFGFTDRAGVHHPAKPFMRPGTEESKEEVAVRMTIGYNRALLKAARKNTRLVTKSS